MEERYERWEYRHGKEVLLAVLVAVGLVFALFVSTQMVGVSETFKHFGDKKAEPVPTPEPAAAPAVVPAVAVDSNQTEKAEIEKTDTDRDGLSDWFEEYLTKTDPAVYNKRFVLLVDVSISETPDKPQPKDDYTQKWGERFFVGEERIPAENVIILSGNWEDGATSSNFKKAVSEISERADNNSLVFIFLWTHGGGTPPSMQFADGKGHENGDLLDYVEVGKMLNKIAAKRMLVVVASCASDTALEPLVMEALYPRVVVLGAREVTSAMGEDDIKYAISDVIYGNSDGYVSLQEAVNYSFVDMFRGEFHSEIPTIIQDNSQIAPVLYLGDYIPSTYKENKILLTTLKQSGQYKGWKDYKKMADQEIYTTKS